MLWLRYRVGVTEESRRFNELNETSKPETDRAITRTLRGTDVMHLLSKRRSYDISIGADELFVPAARTFIEEFWCAERAFIAISSSTTTPPDEDYIELTIPTGACPIEFLEGNPGLPSVAFTLTEKRKR